MLYIRDFDGVDLAANPPAEVTVRAASETGILYELQARVVEDDTSLPVQSVEAAIDWNDGLQPETFDYSLSVSGTLTIDAVRQLAVGNHVLRLEGQNFAAPTRQVAGVNFSVVVLPRIQEAPDTRIVFGPILPKDSGYPNNQQWNFTTGTDLEILASSVKMLLITGKGERVMEPDYGTNLRVLLFEAMTEGMEAIAQQEIVDAITRWEPRVSLVSIGVTRSPDNRSITVDCIFFSKLSQQNFNLPLSFTQ
jgi:phage baseplate assembly protein W